MPMATLLSVTIIFSPESTKSIGEYIGSVAAVARSGQVVTIDTDKPLANGDGLVFVSKNGLVGMRADVVSGRQVTVKDVKGIAPGDKVWRNYNIKFEKELQNDMPRRKIDVEVTFGNDSVTAVDSAGAVTMPLPADAPVADKPLVAVENIRRQMGKRTGHFDFRCTEVNQSPVRFYTAATLNGLRRDLASRLAALRCELAACRALLEDGDTTCHSGRSEAESGNRKGIHINAGTDPTADYTANCANSLAKEVLEGCGFGKVEAAYELQPVKEAQLMRSRYCVKYELGLCPKQRPAHKVAEPLYLLNGGKRLRLQFDCKRCEMIISL